MVTLCCNKSLTEFTASCMVVKLPVPSCETTISLGYEGFCPIAIGKEKIREHSTVTHHLSNFIVAYLEIINVCSVAPLLKSATLPTVEVSVPINLMTLDLPPSIPNNKEGFEPYLKLLIVTLLASSI